MGDINSNKNLVKKLAHDDQIMLTIHGCVRRIRYDDFMKYIIDDNFNIDEIIKDSLDKEWIGYIDSPTVQGNVYSKTQVNLELNKKISKPNSELIEPNADFKYLPLIDATGNSVKILSSNIGRNIFNYSGTTTVNSGLKQGAKFIWDTNGNDYIIKNLKDKSSDISYSAFMVLNNEGDISKASFKTIFIKTPTSLSSVEKLQWRTDIGSITNSPDDTLYLNNNDIMLGTSTYSEEFTGISNITLHFEPTSFIGIFHKGLRLDTSQYDIELPNKIKILPIVGVNDKIIITYNHRII
ncbi:hypothetical protein [Elizabethkingia bruuniana]|uniref:hypothetical protein n=1 Tax=Elizabethkingia bruuniana TaxID=1756149 RepID=UPI00099A5EEB|nr:hypothetical protein [Elizabethkingia bruuniana]ATL41822.1 hypothetical protein CQS02_00150 [Elizabethkingia miricola]MCL1636231.1 hypothetical protein [Elizabethkingia bruuniana]MCT4263340.1 hypothetical protein [Elizabethkingia anophelis]OPC53410.1 hypothetical protein BAY07_15270 [Elizabethkingia bruuniana]